MQVIKIKLPNIKFLFLLMPLLLTEVNALESPVADAAKNGDIALIKQLLKGGIEVNEPQGDGMTALHWAAERGNIELAEVLIYAGANPMAGTRIGQYKPLQLAAKKGNAGIINILLAAGIDPNNEELSCADPIYPKVVLKKYGNTILTSVTIQYAIFIMKNIKLYCLNLVYKLSY